MSLRHGVVNAAAPGGRRLDELGKSVMMMAGVVGLIGIIASVVLASMMGEGGWDRFQRSYLTAFMFVLSISLGGLFFVILQHCVKAGWSVVVRRLAEGVASNFSWLWILFLPILIPVVMGKSHLYEWMHPAGDATLQGKAPYFFFVNPIQIDGNGQEVQTVHVPWFWLARAIFFLGLWAVLARFFVGTSIRQDANGSVSLTQRMEKFAPLAIGLYFLTQAFASMDWGMSLSPHWFSTMFPVYFFAASACGFFAVNILLMYFVQRQGLLKTEITKEHYQDAGKLLFAFGIVFWAYIAYSQYMLIWYASIPEETPWYLARQVGGWGPVTLLLLFGHFVAPFLILISKHPKRAKGVLVLAAAWMVGMHFIDVYWLIMPTVPSAVHEATSYKQFAADVAANMAIGRGNAGFSTALDSGYGWSLLDLTCVIGLAGLLIAGTAKKLSGCSLIPERDPRLHESLAFENI